MVFRFHTELRFIAVTGKDGGAGFAFLYLLVSRFLYSVWDRIFCLSVPLGVSFGGKSFLPTCRFVGLTLTSGLDGESSVVGEPFWRSFDAHELRQEVRFLRKSLRELSEAVDA